MIAKLHIRTAHKNGITFLDQSYSTPPFKVANITEDKRLAQLHLMLMNSSPGILDGDKYELKIELKENSSLQLHTQSYQRLFNMKKGAGQLMEVYLEQGSSFIYLPHPAVPHESSIFSAKNKIYLADNCRLVWGEIVTCGRKLNGEVFKFLKYHNLTEIFFHNKLILKENLLMQPSSINPNVIGQLEGFTHQASLIYSNGNHFNNNIEETLYEFLSGEKEILFGVSATQSNGMIVRIVGHEAEQLHHQLKTITSLIQQQETIQSQQIVYAN